MRMTSPRARRANHACGERRDLRAHVSLARGVVVVSRVRVAPGLRGSAETSAPAECARLSRRARRRAQPCGDAESRLRNVSHAIVRSCVVRLRRVFPRCARVRPREGACRGCIHAGAASNVCVYTFVYTGLYTLSPRAYRARERGRPVPDLPATGVAGSAPGGAPPVVADRRAEGTPRPPGARIARESGALVCAGDADPSRLPCVSQETYMYIRHRWRLYIYRPACHPKTRRLRRHRVTSWSLGRAPPMHLVVTTWHACDARPLCMLALQNVIQIVISVILFV
mgnify:CR=1 FL=1